MPTNEIPSDLLAGWQVVLNEDDPDSLDVAQYILEYYGATVHTAVNGQIGLSLVRQVLPRIVISDLSMPVMDGWEFLTALRQDPLIKDIPVIALTAHAMRGDRERVLAHGFNNYISKPLTADTFIGELIALMMNIPYLSAALNI
jgi:two-component system cell cycle response regulator